MTSNRKKKTEGFGFYLLESPHHFGLEKVKEKKYSFGNKIIETNYDLYEMYESFEFPVINKLVKVVIYGKTIRLLQSKVKQEFDKSLAENRCNKGKWGKEITLFETLLGKELTLLLWGLQYIKEEAYIKTAFINWKNLRREERWWLFTKTNANQGRTEDCNKGWRLAISNILLNNVENIESKFTE